METPAGTISEFVDRLESLARAEGPRKADLARLKRCAGRTLEECPEVYSAFYRLVPYQVRGRETSETWFFVVATLFPAAPERFSGDFGVTMRRLRDSGGEGASGIDRRMTALLDCSCDDLPFRLRQLVRLAASRTVGVDWRKLLEDAFRWDHPARITQKRWARSYFGEPVPTSETQEEGDIRAGTDSHDSEPLAVEPKPR